MTLYRHLLTLNGSDPHVRAAFLDIHTMHQTVMAGFGDRIPRGWENAREALGVLFALDPQTNGDLRVLVQANEPGHWTTGIFADATTTRWEHTPEPGGVAVQFQLRAHPSAKKRRPGKKNSAKVTLRTHTEQLAWLQRHLNRHGARIEHAETGHPLTFASEKKSLPTQQREKVHHVFSLDTVQFQGIATVQDAEAWGQMMATGVGPSKAYGCGLLLTKPLHEAP